MSKYLDQLKDGKDAASIILELEDKIKELEDKIRELERKLGK